MEWNEETYMANKLDNLDELESLQGKLYAGYILVMDKGHIRAEVYRKGKGYVCFLFHCSAFADVGWVRSGRCYSGQDAVVDALHKAGYDCEPELGWADGWGMLRAIGREFGDCFHLYNFGRF